MKRATMLLLAVILLFVLALGAGCAQQEPRRDGGERLRAEKDAGKYREKSKKEGAADPISKELDREKNRLEPTGTVSGAARDLLKKTRETKEKLMEQLPVVPLAQDGSELVICPRCREEQPMAEQCRNCGAVFIASDEEAFPSEAPTLNGDG